MGIDGLDFLRFAFFFFTLAVHEADNVRREAFIHRKILRRFSKEKPRAGGAAGLFNAGRTAAGTTWVMCRCTNAARPDWFRRGAVSAPRTKPMSRVCPGNAVLDAAIGCGGSWVGPRARRSEAKTPQRQLPDRALKRKIAGQRRRCDRNRADPVNIARVLPLFVAIVTVTIRGTWIVARTAWLTVFCLLGLGPFVFVKVITGAPATTVAADIVDATQPLAKANAQEDSLGKADRLPVFRRTEIKQAATLSLAAIGPVDTVQAPMPDDPPRIVGRHWHEANSLPAINRKPTRQPGRERQTTAASREKHCRDGDDAHRTLIRMTACRSTLAASGNASSN